MTIMTPPITVIGTAGQNIWAGRGLHPKRAIVLHVAEGSLSGCDSWFSNPAAQASANYCVGKDGSIHQYVDPAGPDAPFANGIVNGPDADVRQWMTDMAGANPNFWTVSIETARLHAEPLTPAQLHAVAWLTAWECERWGIVPSEHTLLGHYEFDSVSRANCPGLDRAGWLAYEQAVAAFLVTPPTPPAPDGRIAAALRVLPALELATAQLRTALSGTVSVAPADFQPGDPGTGDGAPVAVEG